MKSNDYDQPRERGRPPLIGDLDDIREPWPENVTDRELKAASRLVLVGSIFLALGAIAIPALVGAFILLFSKAQPTIWNAILFTASCIAVALILYFFRRIKRLHYGLLEVGFGSASCFHVFLQIGQSESLSLARWIAILGALYLLVRGFANIEDGLKLRKIDAKARKEEN